MATQSEVRKIEIRIDTPGSSGLKTIAKGFKDVNKGIKESTSVLSSFRNAFFAIQGLSFAGIGVRELVDVADAMQKLGDKLLITEGSAAGASARLGDLTRVANANYTSIEDVAGIYSRLSQALGDSGISSRQLISLTDTLQKSFRLSGSTAAEATAAQIQLSQGLASGQLRGQELRSVLEANVVIGDKLAKQFGITRGELLKFSEKRGGITTTEFFEAIAKGAADIDEQVSKLRPTIKEGLTRNFNDLRVSLDQLNKEWGITEKTLVAIDALFNNLDLVAAAAGVYGLAKAFGFLATTSTLAYAKLAEIGVLIAGSSLYQGIVTAGVAVTSFVVSIASIPLAITAAVTAFVLAFATIKDFREGIIDLTASMAEYIALSFRTPEYRKQYYDQKKAAEELTAKQKELNSTYRSYVLESSDVERGFQATFDAMRDGKEVMGPIQALWDNTNDTIGKGKEKVLDFKVALGILNTEFLEKKKTLAEYNKAVRDISLKDLEKDFKEGTISLEQYNKRLQEINFGKLKNNTKDYQFALKQLNAEFAGSTDVGKYALALNELDMKKANADIKEGKGNVIDLNKALADRKIERYNIELANGVKGFNQYSAAVREANLQSINDQFKAGTMSVQEYNKALTETSEIFNPNSALFTGTNNYIQQAGTISQNVANLVTQTFGRLEDTMVQFTKTGKVNFREFTLAILEDLNRIIIRSLIIRPLAQGLLGAIGPQQPDAAGGTTSMSGDYLAMKAKGGAYNRGVEFFANGGVVNSPTMFGHSRGLGVMGEAGPEAILPLKRSANGDLGVKAAPANVIVNVINQSGAETQQRESTDSQGNRVLDIIILSKVKEGFANGAFDKQLSTQYGIRRRGA